MTGPSADAVAVALVHYPIVGRHGELLTTTVTNLDVHDLARCVRTYGLRRLFVVHPATSQRTLVERLVAHWVDGAGGERIPDRAEAMSRVSVVPHLDDACTALAAERGAAEGRAGVDVWVTAARAGETAPFTFADARAALVAPPRPVLLCFGTGWGLAPRIIAEADRRLEPVRARHETGYNHLSVRGACAIVLDRLFG